MSYDVTIGNFSTNYTFNLSLFFANYIIEGRRGRCGLKVLDGLKGAEAAKVIEKAFASMLRDSRTQTETPTHWFAKAYNPRNGWGDVVQAMLWLEELRRECAKRGSLIVRVYA